MPRPAFFVAIVLIASICQAAPILPSSMDLWDVTQGNTNYHTFYHNDTDDLAWFAGGTASRGINMFGGTGGSAVFPIDATVFPSKHLNRDSLVGKGAVVSITWDTNYPIQLDHFNLFAAHNEFVDANRFTSLRLYSSMDRDVWVPFYDLENVPYPYSDESGDGVEHDPSYKLNELRLSVDTDLVANWFKLELTYANDAVAPLDRGPIIQEIDGFGTVLSNPNDLNYDSIVDASDIDLLIAQVGKQNSPRFDLDQNGLIDYEDVRSFVNGSLHTEFGDANLDGRIDLSDFGTLKQNFGQDAGWAGADFNGVGGVDLIDFGLLKQNFGFARAAAAVPEPATLVYATLALLLLLSHLRR